MEGLIALALLIIAIAMLPTAIGVIANILPFVLIIGAVLAALAVIGWVIGMLLGSTLVLGHNIATGPRWIKWMVIGTFALIAIACLALLPKETWNGIIFTLANFAVIAIILFTFPASGWAIDKTSRIISRYLASLGIVKNPPYIFSLFLAYLLIIAGAWGVACLIMQSAVPAKSVVGYSLFFLLFIVTAVLSFHFTKDLFSDFFRFIRKFQTLPGHSSKTSVTP